jgi:hypothetical protein
VGLFGRSRASRTIPAVTGSVPATPAERVGAVKTDLVGHGLGGAAAQGRPLTPDDELVYVTAAVRHFRPDADERRALCRQMADDLRSMIFIAAVDVEEVLDVLGVTADRLRGNGVSRREWDACRAPADDAIGLVRDLTVGEGEYLDRWRGDDDYVARTLAVLFVVFTRLSV